MENEGVAPLRELLYILLRKINLMASCISFNKLFVVWFWSNQRRLKNPLVGGKNHKTSRAWIHPFLFGIKMNPPQMWSLITFNVYWMYYFSKFQKIRNLKKRIITNVGKPTWLRWPKQLLRKRKHFFLATKERKLKCWLLKGWKVKSAQTFI